MHRVSISNVRPTVTAPPYRGGGGRSNPMSRATRAARPFSWPWVGVSMAAFIAAEVVIGGLIGEWLLARVASISTSFLVQGLINLIGFALGGFVIGLISPGRRIAEPAVAGAATMLLITVVAIFVPFRYVGYSGNGVLIAGAVAAALGAGGAYAGERMTGNVAAIGS